MTSGSEGSGIEAMWDPGVVAARGAGPGLVPDPVALQSLLVFGAVVPPATPWARDTREPDADYARAVEASLRAVRERRSVAGGREELRELGVAMLDQALAGALAGGRRPVVLFSGGVDSSLMAARLRRMGREDALLVHYQFDGHDPESQAAREVARRLGLELAVVQRTPADLDCLHSPGATYPVPFGDISAPPTFELCSSVSSLVDPQDVVVLDGTGADGAFGLGARVDRLQRLRRAPEPALRALGAAYRRGGWRLGRQIEYRLRVARRATSLSPGLALVAQNSLFGVVYDAPDLPAIDAAWRAQIGAAASGSPYHEVVLTDLAVTCASIFAQKTWGPLRSRGYEVAYPFLSQGLGSLGASVTHANPTKPEKQWMKDALLSDVSPDLVHRAKRGFVDPGQPLVARAEFRAAVEAAVADGLFGDLLRRRELDVLLARFRRGGGLPHGHLNVLWVLAFVDRWYKTR